MLPSQSYEVPRPRLLIRTEVRWPDSTSQDFKRTKSTHEIRKTALEEVLRTSNGKSLLESRPQPLPDKVGLADDRGVITSQLQLNLWPVTSSGRCSLIATWPTFLNALQERREPLGLDPTPAGQKPGLLTSWLACSAGTTGCPGFLSRKGLRGWHYERYRSGQVVLTL